MAHEHIETALVRIRVMPESHDPDEVKEAADKIRGMIDEIRSPMIRSALHQKARPILFGTIRKAEEMWNFPIDPEPEWAPRLLRVERPVYGGGVRYVYVEDINEAPFGLLWILLFIANKPLLERREVLRKIGEMKGEHVQAYVAARVEMILHGRPPAQVRRNMREARKAWLTERNGEAPTEIV